MFKNILNHNFIQELESDADIEINKDREKYRPIFDYILNISNSMGLIISDIDLLLVRKKYWEFMQIYHKDANEISKELANSLCKKFGEKLVLKVSEFEESYTIEYGLRRICTIYTLKFYKKYDISEFIKPLDFVSGQHKVMLLPPILEVITLYTYLYNTGMSSNWVSILDTIKQVEVFVQNDLDVIISKSNEAPLLISSPFDIEDMGSKNKASHAKEVHVKTSRNEVKQTLQSLLFDFVSDTDYLLIHDPNDINDTNDTNGTNDTNDHLDTFDIISKNTIDFDYRAISTFFSKYISEGIVYKEKTIYIHNNYTMRKHSFYILVKNGLETRKKHILNIYNNLSFELISYKTTTFGQNNLKVVDFIVSIKFVYINIWSSVLFQRISKYDLEKFRVYVLNQIKLLNIYKERIDLYTKKLNFIGQYEDIFIHKKKLAIANPNINKSSFYCHNL